MSLGGLEGEVIWARQSLDPIGFRAPCRAAAMGFRDNAAARQTKSGGLGVKDGMKRRNFIAQLGSATAAWPLATHAQTRATKPPMLVIGFFHGSKPGGD